MIVSYLTCLIRSAIACRRLYRLRNVAAGVVSFAVAAECNAFAPVYIGLDGFFWFAILLVAIVLARICGGIGASLATDRRAGATFGAIVGAGAVGLWIMWSYYQESLSAKRTRSEIAARQAEVVALKAEFLSLCYSQAVERIPVTPVYAKRVLIIDERHSIPAYLRELFPSITEMADVGFASSVESVRPEKNVLIFRRILNGLTAFGEARIDSMKLELIDSLTGSRVGERIDFSLGGTTCLDQEWLPAYRAFSMRVIGFVPGDHRTDVWVEDIPKRYLQAKLVSRASASREEFNAEVLPSDVKLDDWHHQLKFEETKVHVREGPQTRLVGFKVFPDRVLTFYSAAQHAPRLKIEVWSRKSSRLLYEGYMPLPREISDSYLRSGEALRWRVANESIKFVDQKLVFDVLQEELVELPELGRYVRYSVVSDWIAEQSDTSPLPDYVADGGHTAFELPPKTILRSVAEKDIVGDWVSYPAGANWSFKPDGTVKFSRWEKHAQWRIDGAGVLVETVDSYHWRKFKLRLSRDRKFMDVIQTKREGSYRPFLLTRNQRDNG